MSVPVGKRATNFEGEVNAILPVQEHCTKRQLYFSFLVIHRRQLQFIEFFFLLLLMNPIQWSSVNYQFPNEQRLRSCSRVDARSLGHPRKWNGRWVSSKTLHNASNRPTSTTNGQEWWKNNFDVSIWIHQKSVKTLHKTNWFFFLKKIYFVLIQSIHYL